MKSSFGLSILLPCYNRDCSAQVTRLCALASPLVAQGVGVEVIVMEDGSVEQEALQANAQACAHALCRHVIRTENVGRAMVRNLLAAEARYQWLLFLDCDLVPAGDDFLEQYVQAVRLHPEAKVVYGGLLNIAPAFPCLRYRYEQATAARHTVQARQNHPYASLSMANMMLHADVARQIPFDQRFRTYGYEDVMFGRQLRLNEIPILHIDNPVEIRDFDTNEQYVCKTEQAMRTLHQFADELQDDVTMLRKLKALRRYVPLGLLHFFARLAAPVLRRNLSGNNPDWRFFNPYKLCYYVLLE